MKRTLQGNRRFIPIGLLAVVAPILSCAPSDDVAVSSLPIQQGSLQLSDVDLSLGLIREQVGHASLRVKNVGPKPITEFSMNASCACTIPTLNFDSLLQGQEETIQFEISMANKTPGKIKLGYLMSWIEVNESQSISGSIGAEYAPDAYIKPAAVELHLVEGEAREFSLRAFSFTPEKPTLSALCNNPNIEIHKIGEPTYHLGGWSFIVDLVAKAPELVAQDDESNVQFLFNGKTSYSDSVMVPVRVTTSARLVVVPDSFDFGSGAAMFRLIDRKGGPVVVSSVMVGSQDSKRPLTWKVSSTQTGFTCIDVSDEIGDGDEFLFFQLESPCSGFVEVPVSRR